jgi:hypothetical protein
MIAGHNIKRSNVATLDFPILRSQDEWEMEYYRLV